MEDLCQWVRGCESCLKLAANRERFLPLKAHHTHNKPPNTMLAAITEMLPTTHIMNKSYSNMGSAS